MTLERLSLELSQRCSKACWFCYSRSSPQGQRRWTDDEVVALIEDCARHGVRSVSFGGGEPLEEPLLWPVLERLRGVLPRTLTSNGLPLLDPATLERLVAARPDKVHLSIHFPGHRAEVTRVIEQLAALQARGVRCGVNLLVQRSRLAAARQAAQQLHAAGIDNHRIVYLPMRGTDTPTPQQVAAVAGAPFQSMTCLRGCAKSPRFASIGWDKTVAWCSYTTSRRPLASLSFRGLVQALDGLPLSPCDQPERARSPADPAGNGLHVLARRRGPPGVRVGERSAEPHAEPADLEAPVERAHAERPG
ncbi:MAG: radical SAM protein [Myxococcales bacterium]|nr:radical SAM protein [Myxococcales bacterium]